MQKSLKIVIISAVLLILLGSTLALYFLVVKKDNNIYVEDITLKENVITMHVYDTYEINNAIQVLPANFNVQIMCYAENSNYISIVNGYTIKAKAEGETKVVVKALNSKDTYIDKVLNINILPKETYPDSFSFNFSKVALNKDETTINNIVSSKLFTAIPSISYSVDNICSYDYSTGEVVAKNIGSTFVKVSFQTDTSLIENQFEVVVTNLTSKIVPTNVVKENDDYILNVSVNTYSRIYLSLFDAEGSPASFATNYSLGENSVEMNVTSQELNCIKFICNKKGEQTIKIYKTSDETVFVNIKIIVGD